MKWDRSIFHGSNDITGDSIHLRSQSSNGPRENTWVSIPQSEYPLVPLQWKTPRAAGCPIKYDISIYILIESPEFANYVY